ncbi:MAG: MBOAT family protein [Prevotella sp.]|uniref:MBOAT family O-acyltransferase n=1 Tax=Prevotella sp. TaxID=59823 RepID=UPI00258B59CC|nr:MBOAT family O-acyltransferase [Prevotella sp.]MDD6853756.1 MBOAT family protein [Prevotella sp.]
MKAYENKVSNYILLIISYCLYAKASPVGSLFLLTITAITYLFALLIERKQSYGKRIYILVGAMLSLLPLTIFKYYNFILENIRDLFSAIDISIGLPGLNWAIPLGISFYSFQAVGYLFDVYYKRIKAEHNWWDYMLFVGFFPQIVSGPISKAKDLLPQIKSERDFNYDKCVEGLRWLLWGFFLKIAVADRLALYINNVLDNYPVQTGSSCLVASILYAFQIYTDFAGYSLMAIGVGAIMGFELINNFRRPYLAVSVTDFWRRWHISLSTWLKDYVYIPLGGNRCSKLTNYFNIFVTFLVSGIWHGASWTFIVWGILHGIFQIIEKMLGLQKYDKNNFIRIIRILITFFLVTFAWIFFRMTNLNAAIDVVCKIFTDLEPSIYMTGSHIQDLLIVTPLLVVILKDWIEEFSNFSLFHNKFRIIRWCSYFVVLFYILLFGVFDASSFIYANF